MSFTSVCYRRVNFEKRYAKSRPRRTKKMFLIRAAFWLSLVVMLIPADPDSGQEAPRVSAMQAIFAARATVADMSGFCNRNPDVCSTGGAAFSVFAEKARIGARKLYDYFGDDGEGDPDGDTLRQEDLEPGWRGSAAPGRSA
jgi:hypothetical protein